MARKRGKIDQGGQKKKGLSLSWCFLVDRMQWKREKNRSERTEKRRVAKLTSRSSCSVASWGWRREGRGCSVAPEKKHHLSLTFPRCLDYSWSSSRILPHPSFLYLAISAIHPSLHCHFSHLPQNFHYSHASSCILTSSFLSLAISFLSFFYFLLTNFFSSS